MEEIDFLIIGQGLAGSVLAYQLIQQNKKVLIIDESSGATSSRQATGLINPITGRRFVKSWMTEQLMPYAKNFYTAVEKQLNASFFKETKQVKILQSVEQQNDFYIRLQDNAYTAYLHKSKENLRDFNNPIEAIETTPIYQIEINELQDVFLKYFKSKACILQEKFDFRNFKIEPSNFLYNNIKAKYIIFAEGYLIKDNPYFSFIPEHHTKGEALVVENKELDIDFVLNSYINITPSQNKQYYVGATYDWNDLSENTTAKKRAEMVEKWDRTTSLALNIVEQKVGIRPTTVDRRPLLGSHPKHNKMYVFNGMGTKGLSLAPYFARHLIEHIILEKPLLKEVNIARFYGE
ncbi:MAG: FAD-dependent oxidoreductase [Chitinophagales bacterium]